MMNTVGPWLRIGMGIEEKRNPPTEKSVQLTTYRLGVCYLHPQMVLF